jgi:formylglycine-generating enzyme required for sulfatase activity
VTNLQFRDFLDDSGYTPVVGNNFLKHWINGKLPQGKEDHPVVYVDTGDARAYAEWAGKRLPTEYEWQLAAQGPDSCLYPWGNEMESGRCNENTNGETSSVYAFPRGGSAFGCLDMSGNTWELTGNEYSDGRTRFIMLKGGSCYKASGSEWYFDGGPHKNNFVAKMLLIWPGLDRCSTVGFRCAVDL